MIPLIKLFDLGPKAQCLYFSKVVLRGKKVQSSFKREREKKKREERMGYDL